MSLFKHEVLISLNELKIGRQRFRYIHVPASSIQMASSREVESDFSNNPVVLFFGADVLSHTSVSTKNMARQHLKMSRDNHCCRVTLPHRLLGVAGRTNIAWFYDIHGLLQSVFEFYEIKDQKYILNYFFKMWYNAPIQELPSELHLSSTDLLKTDLVLTVLTDKVENCQLCQQNASSRELTKQDQAVQCQPIQKYLVHSSSQTQFEELTEMETIPTNRPQSNSNVTNENISLSQNAFDGYPGIDSFQEDSLSFIKTLQLFLQRFFLQASKDIKFYKVFSLLECVLYVIQEELTDIENQNTGVFPLHILVDYANTRKAFAKNNCAENSIKLQCQEYSLHLISKWLAYQFHNFHTVISTRVEAFKHQQIEQNISILNPTEVITQHELFPSCMIDFLSAWMGGYETIDEKDFFCSRLVLLLELLNDSLLSGMGHVVYAKLKCNNSL